MDAVVAFENILAESLNCKERNDIQCTDDGCLSCRVGRAQLTGGNECLASGGEYAAQKVGQPSDKRSQEECVLCRCTVGSLKHGESVSHRRRARCRQLLQPGNAIMRTIPSAKSLKKLHYVLATRKNKAVNEPLDSNGGVAGATGADDAYLFSTNRKNWPDLFIAGPNEDRGSSSDIAKIWFRVFLTILKERCEVLQTEIPDHDRKDWISKIDTTINTLDPNPNIPCQIISAHTLKRQKSNSCTKVAL
jgi:hypothetical protein